VSLLLTSKPLSSVTSTLPTMRRLKMKSKKLFYLNKILSIGVASKGWDENEPWWALNPLILLTKNHNLFGKKSIWQKLEKKLLFFFYYCHRLYPQISCWTSCFLFCFWEKNVEEFLSRVAL
jgi:hypothetical protein